MAQRRLERVGHLVQAELARLLLTSVRDPRLRDVTITGVRMSADLRHAWVYFRTLADIGDGRAIGKALAGAAPFLRGAVGRALGTKAVPELHFSYDRTPDDARRVEALLDATRAEDAPEEESDGDES